MKQIHGFSLLELSIVLVIIGLIAGGIVAGSSMIRAAEIRSVITDVERYKTATYTFRDKYLGLPGDLKNATAFWGAADTSGTGGECGDSYTDVGTGTETCNGDGDNRIFGYGTGWSEVWRAWQHLANAELISGNYTGNQTSAGESFTELDVNIPSTKTGDAGYAMRLGILRVGFGEGVDEPFVTGAEMWSIDKKLDDGKPLTGHIYTFGNTTRPACSSTDVTATSEYLLDNESEGCNFFAEM